MSHLPHCGCDECDPPAVWYDDIVPGWSTMPDQHKRLYWQLLDDEQRFLMRRRYRMREAAQKGRVLMQREAAQKGRVLMQREAAQIREMWLGTILIDVMRQIKERSAHGEHFTSNPGECDGEGEKRRAAGR